jgi:hypothetical protein
MRARTSASQARGSREIKVDPLADLTYGVGVTDGTNLLDYVSPLSGSVPEPAVWTLMLVGIGGLGARVRAGRGRAAFAA